MKIISQKYLVVLGLVFFVSGIFFIAFGQSTSADTLQFPDRIKLNFTWQKGIDDPKEKGFFLGYAAQDNGKYLLTILGNVDDNSTSIEWNKTLESDLSFNTSYPKQDYKVFGHKWLSATEETIVAEATGRAYVEGIYLKKIRPAKGDELGCGIKVVYMVSARENVSTASFSQLKADMKKIVEQGLIVDYEVCYSSYKKYCPVSNNAVISGSSGTQNENKEIVVPLESNIKTVPQQQKPNPLPFKTFGYVLLAVSLGTFLLMGIMNLVVRKQAKNQLGV